MILEADNRQSHDVAAKASLHLSEDEKRAVIAFLHTLTDEDFVRAKEFSDPFTQHGKSDD